MKNAVKSGIRQAVNGRLCMVILAVVAMIGFSLAKDLLKLFQNPYLLPAGFHNDLLVQAITSDTFAPALPLLASLPFSGCYVDDIKSKFARFFLLRTSYGRYLASRFLVCFLMGGLVIGAGCCLAWGGIALLMMPMEQAGEGNPAMITLAIQTVLLASLCGGFWAVVGMTMSTLMESKYIAYASPFVIYYLLIILCERYFTDAVLFYPMQWLNPSEGWPFGPWGVAVLLLELTALAALVFFFRGKRRLREL